MKKLSILIVLLTMLFNAKVLLAEENSIISTLFQSVEAAYCSVAIHEAGHYKEARDMSIAPRVKFGFITSKAENGSASYYLGKTAYEKYPEKRKIRRQLALAGLEASTNTYATIDKKIKTGEINSRFGSMLALLCKTDFARYALIHGTRNNLDPNNDLETYIQNSDADKNFIYQAAVLDILFNLQDIMFHSKKILGRNSLAPQQTEICGFKAKPEVFIRRYSGISVGFSLKKNW
ncbi:MAG: hypothetical protein GY853_00365 [PVC group bacterium]|nr:hypothetical protein [PVC group bacterium]